MSDTPRRRLTDQLGASPTLIGTGTHFQGQIQCRSDLIVSGTFEGNAKVDGAFTLSDTGQWEGEVIATTAIVAGELHGQLSIADRLEIRKSARIRGAIRAKTIAIATGAIVDGDMSVTSNAPVVRFEEKRTS